MVKEEKNTSMYYNGNLTLTKNCLYNFIVGPRGAGKTYWSKLWSVRDFLKTGKQFVYVRRYEKEIKKPLKTFWNAILKEFPDHTLTVKGNEFFIDDKLAGYAIVLSTAKIEKSSDYPLVNKIIFDEFIIEKGVYRYLPNEVTAFLDLYDTFDRSRDETIVFFLSNAVTMTNPYFLYFNLRLPYGKNFYRRDDLVLLELVDVPEFVEMKKKTRFGRLIANTEYGNYNMDNQFLLDNNTFIEKKSGRSKYCFTIMYKNNQYGVWVDYSAGKMYVSEDIDKNCRIIYTLTLNDHSPNALLIKNLSNSALFGNFIKNYKSGLVYFETIKVKNIVYDIIRMVLV